MFGILAVFISLFNECRKSQIGFVLFGALFGCPFGKMVEHQGFQRFLNKLK